MKDKPCHVALVLLLVATGACSSSSHETGQGGAGGNIQPLTSNGVGNNGGGPVACSPGETHECYQGPPGTRDVGNCKAGTQSCTDAGIFGSCHGQILPKTESCEHRGDEDCDGNACADAIWDKVGGDASDQQVLGIAIDDDGNTYVSGAFGGTLNLGGGAVTAAAADGFVAKFDPTGKHLWESEFAISGSVGGAKGMAILPTGEVAVAASAGNSAVAFKTKSFPAPTHDSGYAVFYDAMGKEQWVKAIQGTGNVTVSSIAFDAGGNIIVGGSFAGALTCTAGACPTSAGGTDGFARAYDATGAELWTKGFGGANDESITGVAPTPDGHILLAGVFAGPTTSLLGTSHTSPGGQAVFVVKTKSTGVGESAITLGSASGASAVIAARQDGSFLLGGSAGDEITVNDINTGDGATGAYLFSFDGSMKPQWAKSLGISGSSTVESLASDFQGNVYAGGSMTKGKANFGGGLLNNPDMTENAALTKISDDGTFIWAKSFTGSGRQMNTRVASNAHGTSAFSVSYQDKIDFGLGAHTSSNADGDTAFDLAITSFQP